MVAVNQPHGRKPQPQGENENDLERNQEGRRPVPGRPRPPRPQDRQAKTASDESYHLSIQIGRETLFFPSDNRPKIELLDDGATLLIVDDNRKTCFVDAAAIDYIDL